MGRVLYCSYWKETIFEMLQNAMAEISQRQLTISEISKRTFIAEHDVLMILKEVNLLKYYRGIHSLVDEPQRIQRTLKQYHTRQTDKLAGLLK